MKTFLLKTLVVLCAVLCTAELMAQVPQGFNFQAVARDANGELLANTSLGVKISILKGSEEGASVYSETQTPTTNATGMIQLVIGEGTSEEDFSAIDWSSNNYFVKLEIDPAGGTEYEALGTTRLLSVPYALLAHDVVNGTSAGGDIITEYNLNSSEGDTSFIINATGATTLAGLQSTASTDELNRGVVGRTISTSANTSNQYGLQGQADGEGTGAHVGVYGSSVTTEAASGSRYGFYGYASSKSRYNFGIQAIAAGEGDGTIIPLGEEGGPDGFGSYNIAGYFSSSGNLNGNVGVEAQAVGSTGARADFGVIGRASATNNSANVGIRAEAFNSTDYNIAFDGDATSNASKNLGLRINAWNGTSNIGMEVNADTAAILNGHSIVYGSLHVGGDITHTGSITQTSDRSLKEDIEELEGAMATIMRLNPTTYKFKGNGSYNGLTLSAGQHYGLIAQEVEEVIPSLVKTNTHTFNEDGVTKTMDYKSLNYTELIPLLIKAVQEQQQEIDALKAELEKLKK